MGLAVVAVVVLANVVCRGRGNALDPSDGVVPGEDGEGDEHGHGLEDVQAPLVPEGVAVDAEGEFDDAEDGADLSRNVLSASSPRGP